jgi:ATPase subunit of ABC transporter with duplicated ATPase domains
VRRRASLERNVPSIHLDHVWFAYSDSVSLLEDVELRLERGWYGVVGANGAGKTTLLRLAAGELEPDRGAVALHPAGAPLLYCPQEVGARTSAVCDLAAADDGSARRLRGQPELSPGELDRWQTLSPGERKRWQIGAALAGEPSFLLLDEPTNHLDARARDLLAGALADYRGLGLLVSHDRALLDGLTTVTLRVARGGARLWSGGYGQARASWLAEESGQRRAWAGMRDRQKKLERRATDRRQRKAQGLAKERTIKRTSHPKDTASRRPFKMARRRSLDASLGREIHKLKDEISRVEDERSKIRLSKDVGRTLYVDYQAPRRAQLMSLVCPELRAGPRTLLRDVSVAVQRESRIHVAGVNGSGKTTLLHALLDACTLPDERRLYLPQEVDPDEGADLLDRVRRLPGAVRGRVLNLVAALGVSPDALLASGRPSPGEARKLALAWGLGRQVWLLVLDEPTNHLDLPSIERLEQSLVRYPGALVLVTHDDALASALTTTTWELRDGGLVVR